MLFGLGKPKLSKNERSLKIICLQSFQIITIHSLVISCSLQNDLSLSTIQVSLMEPWSNKKSSLSIKPKSKHFITLKKYQFNRILGDWINDVEDRTNPLSFWNNKRMSYHRLCFSREKTRIHVTKRCQFAFLWRRWRKFIFSKFWSNHRNSY